MSKIKDESYYQVSGWMINRLGLKGNELLIYAIIFGFTQDGESKFTGNRQYIADFIGVASLKTVSTALNALVEKGYILKEQAEVNGVIFNNYNVNMEAINGDNDLPQGGKNYMGVEQKLHGGCGKNYTGGVVKFTPNNNINNTNINNIDIDYKRIIDTFNETCVSLPKCTVLSAARKKAIKCRIDTYGKEQVWAAMQKVAASEFLNGKNNRNWKANFDWVFNDTNMAKILDNYYTNKSPVTNVNRAITTQGKDYSCYDEE